MCAGRMAESQAMFLDVQRYEEAACIEPTSGGSRRPSSQPRSRVRRFVSSHRLLQFYAPTFLFHQADASAVARRPHLS